MLKNRLVSGGFLVFVLEDTFKALPVPQDFLGGKPVVLGERDKAHM